MYPEGMPTSVQLDVGGNSFDSGLIQFPAGHAQNTDGQLIGLLMHKFKMLGKLAMEPEELQRFVFELENIQEMGNEDLHEIYDCNLKFSEESLDRK